MTGTLLAGRYEVGELLGEGGSARVYRAHDRHLGREVAVKAVHEHLPPADRQRFLREIRTLARLTHPGVVTVYDLGEQGPHLYFTMPLLAGGPITVLGPLEDDPEQLGRFLTTAAFVARALGHVHDSGLIHRDLTPGNILLDEAGVPRIMDFGLVALSEYSRHLTRSGVTLGTPQYMAPEQARGVGVGPFSDLYALGAVLYRVACGSPPFVGDSDQSILYQHVYDDPTDPRELNPAIPDGLAQVLLRLLSKKPGERPEHGVALAEQLLLARRDAWAMSSRSQYRGGRNRSGEQQDGPLDAAGLRAEWTTRLPGEVTWPSAVLGRNGLLAVGTRSGKLCLVSSSGVLQGQLLAGDEVTAPATFHGDSVLYGAWDGLLRRSTLAGQEPSRELWSHRTRAEITGAPTVWGQRVLSSSRDGHLHAVNLQTGVLEWAYRASGPIAATPLVWGGAAIVADEEGWVHALDANTGTQLWRVQLQTVHATPALAQLGRGEAALLVGCWPGEVHALHLSIQNGHARPHPEEPLLWTYDLEDELWAAPAVGSGTVILAGWGGRVRAVTLRGGDDLWDCQLEGRITASPVIGGGLVYLATEAGELCALSLKTGAVVWQTREKVGIQATPLLSAGGLTVAFMDGTLRSYRAPGPR